MIVNLYKLIEMCVDSTGGTIPIEDLMNDYQVIFIDNGLSLPITDARVDRTNNEIELR